MKPSITVIEEKIDNEIVEKIKISGATNHQEELQAAEESCDENKCKVQLFGYSDNFELTDNEQTF